ncbi:MAG: hypothetical protein KDB88_06870 [Flavobacteriales bacterium]|nr:hypothetical protein [Flavobacteriales bacterium]
MKALLIAMSLAFLAHDFYISILTLRHNPEASTLEVTWRMTAHDIEYALSPKAELKLGSDQEHPQADSLLDRYFSEHLVVSLGDRQLSWSWVGKELEGETLYCYLQIAEVGSVEGIEVGNTLLQEVFPEQQNLVHVEGPGLPARSHTFIRGSASHRFIW